MGIFDWLFPAEKDFYKMLQNQSGVTLKGLNIFQYVVRPLSRHLCYPADRVARE